MKLKRQKGATLGLVAVCVLVIIVLGIGFFILSQILGGGREIANATDAGVLTVARKALSPTLITVPLSGDSGTNPVNDFIAFDPNNVGNVLNATSGNIDMLGVNRVIAQAVLVALNAQEINTPTASGHAQNVATAAKTVATALRNMIQGGSMPAMSATSQLPAQFNTVAQANNTKMFEGNKVNLQGGAGGLTSTFMRTGYSTNVYMSQPLISALPVSPPSNLVNQNPNALKHTGSQYMAGYINFGIPAGNGSTVNIAGIPLFPQQKPHLVDIGEFSTDANAASGQGQAPFNGGTYLPPNAFRANTQTLESNSSTLGGAVGCALVGCLQSDFVASLPRGYVRIINGPSALQTNPPISSVADGTNDVFNNELWPPNGNAEVSNNGVYALSSSPAAQSYITQWQQFNAGSTTVQPPGPGQPGYPTGVYIITPNGFANPTLAQLQAIRSQQECDALNIWDNPTACFAPNTNGSVPSQGDLVNAIEVQNNISPGSQPLNPTNGLTAIEYQKAELLAQAGHDAYCATVTPVGPTGMKVFTVGDCYATPFAPVNFGVPGSPLQYINQIGNGGQNACATDVITKITNRMQEADATLTQAQVQAALGSSPVGAPSGNDGDLDLSETLYLYSPGPGTVQLAYGTPGSYFNSTLQNDGTSSAAVYNCSNTYNISHNIVDANKDNAPGFCPRGDADYHQEPYTQGPGYLPGTDSAIWTPSSGWRNLLGDIQFENTASGGGTFCKPN